MFRNNKEKDIFEKNNESQLRPDLVYSNVLTSYHIKMYSKTIFIYAFELILWIIISKLYLNFGNKWIIPSVSAMWVMGAITTFFIKEEKQGTIKETRNAILGYLCFLFLYRCVIQLIAPISSEQMGASLNITVPAASGLATAGLLQNILIIVSVMTPVGFLIWCGQKFKNYTAQETKQDAFKNMKGYKKNQRRY